MSTKAPAIQVDPNSPVFDSADEAANAFAATFGSSKKINEKAGVLFKSSDGKYRYSTAIEGTNDQFALRAQVPDGMAFGGIVHSHPGTDARGAVFSPDDVSAADKLKVPSYIRFSGDNGVRKYVPGQTKTSQMSDPTSRMPLTVARGDSLTLPDPSQPQVIRRSADSTQIIPEESQ